MAPPRLSLVILAVADLERAVRFHTLAFGWHITVRAAVYIELALPDGMRLGLYQRSGFERNTGMPASDCPPGHTTGTELYLYVDDIEVASARLTGLGALCLSPQSLRPWGEQAAYFRDPDGNVVVLARPAAQA